MTWIKLDDSCPHHPKLVGLPDAAFACWVRGICYSSLYLTDGLVPTAALRQVGTPKAAAELVIAGLWVVVEGGWRIHDYEDHQSSRDDVLDRRDKARERQQRHRAVTRMSQRDTPVSHIEVTLPEVLPEVEVEVEVEVERERDTPPTPPDGLAPALIVRPTAFDEFWSVYPAKKQKGAAERAWARAIKTTTPAVIIDGAARYRTDARVIEGIVRNPATWLNGKGWLDEPTPTRPNTNGMAASVARLRTAIDTARPPAQPKELTP